MNDVKATTTFGSRYLARERATMERFLPGLDAKLAELPLMTLESPGSPGIALLKAAKGANLVIPAKYGGLGANAVETMRVHRAIGARSPSLAIVCTMHNFSASTLVEYAVFGEEYGEVLLTSISENAMLLASGFAEARPGARPLDMTMQAHATPSGGWKIFGRKKPCTLSISADFITAGVTAHTADGKAHRGVALIPRDSQGIEVRPFWKAQVLAGAESDELIVTDVEVPGDFVFLNQSEVALDPVELVGYVWLQMCLVASYIGAGSGLIERVLKLGDKIPPLERMAAVTDVETAFMALEAVARGVMDREDTEELLARIVAIRYAAMSALERAAMKSAELLGGLQFITGPDVSYLMAATRALAFHPPSRSFGSAALAKYYDGAPLDLA